MRRTVRVLLAAVVVGAVAGAVAATPVAAQDTGWTIESFDVAIELRPGGTIQVVERIEVDFGGLERRGIYRVLPVRYDLDASAFPAEAPGEHPFALPSGLGPQDVLRALDIDRISVTSTAPDEIELTRPDPIGGRDLSIRIGDPDRTVSGRHRYEVAYRARGALNAFPDHDELYWNVTGSWPVPIERVSVTVHGARLVQAACFRGVATSTRLCDDVRLQPGAAPVAAAAEHLLPGEQLTLVVGIAPGQLDVPPPLLVEKWRLARALAGSPWAWPLFAIVALLMGGWLGRLLYRQGRDRVAVAGQSINGMATGQVPDSAPRALFSPRSTPVQFRPPEDLRPAQLGFLVDERVDPVDVSATLVHLAVRGYLVIEEETSKVLWISRTDWTLRRTGKEPSGLLPYERALLDGLFADAEQVGDPDDPEGGTWPEVSVSDLKGEFATEYQKVEKAIEDDAVARRWFAKKPSTTRSRWLVAGILLAMLGTGLLVVGLLFSHLAVAAIPVMVAGLVLMVAHRWMPHRTALGSDLLDRTLGFREFVRTAETGRMQFAEEENLFVAYLPFAVVFGAVDKWAQAFAHLGTEAAEQLGTWYVASSTGRLGPNLTGFSAGLSDFAGSVGGSLATTPASSGGSGFSGGSSGGGMGGGGGGSW